MTKFGNDIIRFESEDEWLFAEEKEEKRTASKWVDAYPSEEKIKKEEVTSQDLKDKEVLKKDEKNQETSEIMLLLSPEYKPQLTGEVKR
jgi:hypothetical protein